MKLGLITLWIVAGLLAALVSGAADQKGAPTPARSLAGAGPRMGMASTVYDFGKVSAGELVKHDFVFTNPGKATLEIFDVQPGCGCTTAGTWTRKVKPGRRGVIPLEFNSANFSGAVSKQATVRCNDPSQTNVVLEIRGTVWRPIEVSASMVTFNVSTESAARETRTVRILSNLDEPLKLSAPRCTNDSFQAELETVREGREFELRISAAGSPAWSFAAAPVTLQTSSARMPAIEVMAYVMVQQPVTVIPPQLLLPAGPFSNAVHEVITILYLGTNSLALSAPAINVPGVAMRLQETQPGRAFNLTLDFPVGFLAPPGQKTEVTVKSNHAKFPLLKMPVYQIERSSGAGKGKEF